MDIHVIKQSKIYNYEREAVLGRQKGRFKLTWYLSYLESLAAKAKTSYRKEEREKTNRGSMHESKSIFLFMSMQSYLFVFCLATK